VRYIKVCPQCGSTRIFYEAGGITGEVYHCQTCGYVGALILEQEIDESALPPEPKPEKVKKKRKGLFGRE
jgi:DNA-directed RNA polymerase subunit RPC12/RpoP